MFNAFGAADLFYIVLLSAVCFISVRYLMSPDKPKREEDKKHASDLSRKICLLISDPNLWKVAYFNSHTTYSFPNNPFELQVKSYSKIKLLIYTGKSFTPEPFDLKDKEISDISQAIVDVQNRIKQEEIEAHSKKQSELAKEVDSLLGLNKDRIRSIMNAKYKK